MVRMIHSRREKYESNFYVCRWEYIYHSSSRGAPRFTTNLCDTLLKGAVQLMAQACQVIIVKLCCVTRFLNIASQHSSVAVCLQSGKNNFWSIVWAGYQPSFPESFRVLSVSVLLHGAGEVARVIGVVMDLGSNECQPDTGGLLGRGGRGCRTIILPFFL